MVCAAWQALRRWGLALAVLAVPGAAARADQCRDAVQTFEVSLAAYRADIAKLPAPGQPRDEAADARPPEDRVREALAAIETLSTQKNDRLLAETLVDLAAARQQASQYQQALAALTDAEGIYAKIEPSGSGMAALLRMRAFIFSNMRKREDALREIGRAIALYASEAVSDPAMAALSQRTKSDILRGLNRFTEALDALTAAERYYQSQGQDFTRDLIEVLIDKSIILSRLNDWPQQLAASTKASELAKSGLGLASRTTARALHNRAIGLRRAERPVEALSDLAGAFAIFDAQGASRQAGEAEEEAARTLNVSNCFDEAVAFESKAISIYKARYGSTHASIAAAKHRLGAYMRSMGTSTLALARFAEAAALYDELLGPGNVRSAEVLRDTADLQLDLNRTGDALNNALLSLKALEQTVAPEEQRKSLYLLSRILRQTGNREGAILFAKRAVNKQQEIRSQNKGLPPDLAATFAERYRELYLYLSGLLIEDGRLAEAQRVIDLIKSQEVIDFVRGGPPRTNNADGRAPLTKSERTALADLDALVRAPVAVSKELEELLAKSKKAPLGDAEAKRLDSLKQAFHDNYKTFQNDVKALLGGLGRESAAVQGEVKQLHLDMLGQARKKLRQFDDRAVMLQIASLDDKVHIFLTTSHAQVHRESAITRLQLAQLAYDAWNATSQASPAAGMHLARLYDVLIRPVEGDLKASGADVIMLNLEGFLRYIPFAALKNGDRYLIEDYALTMQTPAAETVYAAGGRDPSRAVGFGVTKAFGDFPGLPAVAGELESIFSGSDESGVLQGMPRLDADFDADQFASALEAAPEFVHIASHFKLEPGDESKSFLLLGNGEPLSLEAIRSDARFAFNDVDLLTLSACETAGEVGSDGKEVESFATLAQGSGASSVMATLWPIADASTAELMGSFYRELLDDDLDKATALRAAQVAMLRGVGTDKLAFVKRGASAPDEEPASASARHPYYWSAFILMGNWL